MNVKKHHLGTAVAAAFALLATTAPLAGAQTATVLCSGVEATIVGTPGDDAIFGTDGDDVIALLQGNDFLFGGGGDDIFCGGFGNDSLFGGDGFDTIFGAQGDDVIGGNWDANNVVVPQDLLDDTRGLRAFGGAGDDTIIGTNRWDRMQGGLGDDTLLGYEGRDRLRGGGGNDILVGHEGIDDLGAGSGNDTVAADRLDTNVRGAGGFDTCPSISVNARATNWLGCEDSYQTAPLNPLLPVESFPSQLAGGTANTYVFEAVFGEGNRADGIAFLVDGPQLMVAGPDFELEPLASSDIRLLAAVHLSPVTPGEAEAIAEAFIVRREFDWEHVLNPNSAFYDEAVAWGHRWGTLNTAG